MEVAKLQKFDFVGQPAEDQFPVLSDELSDIDAGLFRHIHVSISRKKTQTSNQPRN